MTTKTTLEPVTGFVSDELSTNFGAHILDISWDADGNKFILTRGTQGTGVTTLNADELHQLGRELVTAAGLKRLARLY